MNVPRVAFAAALSLPIVSLAVAQQKQFPDQVDNDTMGYATWCIQKNVPCLIEGNPPPTPHNEFLHKPIGPVLDRWLAHTAYDWKLYHGIIIVSPRSTSDPLMKLLKKRIDIDIDKVPADRAFETVLSRAGIRSAGWRGFEGFINPVYPLISLHAKHVSVHEALKRIMIQNSQFYVQIEEPPSASDFVPVTMDSYGRPPIW